MKLLVLSAVLAVVAAAGTLSAQEEPAIAIVPEPASLEVRPGSFTLTPDTVILTDPASNVAARWLATYLGAATGHPLPVANGTVPARNRVVFRMDASLARLGDTSCRRSS